MLMIRTGPWCPSFSSFAVIFVIFTIDGEGQGQYSWIYEAGVVEDTGRADILHGLVACVERP